MGYNLLINGVYWGYNPFTNHLLTSWDMQVGLPPWQSNIKNSTIFWEALLKKTSPMRHDPEIWLILYPHLKSFQSKMGRTCGEDCTSKISIISAEKMKVLSKMQHFLWEYSWTTYLWDNFVSHRWLSPSCWKRVSDFSTKRIVGGGSAPVTRSGTTKGNIMFLSRNNPGQEPHGNECTNFYTVDLPDEMSMWWPPGAPYTRQRNEHQWSVVVNSIQYRHVQAMIANIKPWQSNSDLTSPLHLHEAKATNRILPHTKRGQNTNIVCLTIEGPPQILRVFY